MGVKVDQKVNVSGCVRCLECSTCGALEPCFAVPDESPKPAPPPEPRSGRCHTHNPGV